MIDILVLVVCADILSWFFMLVAYEPVLIVCVCWVCWLSVEAV